jgi:hypothetical protein
MSDLTPFILSVSELFLIEIVVVLPGCLSCLFVGLHDTPHICAPRLDHVICFWVMIDTRHKLGSKLSQVSLPCPEDSQRVFTVRLIVRGLLGACQKLFRYGFHCSDTY